MDALACATNSTATFFKPSIGGVSARVRASAALGARRRRGGGSGGREGGGVWPAGCVWVDTEGRLFFCSPRGFFHRRKQASVLSTSSQVAPVAVKRVRMRGRAVDALGEAARSSLRAQPSKLCGKVAVVPCRQKLGYRPRFSAMRCLLVDEKCDDRRDRWSPLALSDSFSDDATSLRDTDNIKLRAPQNRG